MSPQRLSLYRVDEEPTLLHRAVRECDYEKVLKCLNSGFPVNARDNSDMTPLHLAFYNVDYSIPATKALPSIISALVSAGADVNAVEKNRGRTVIHFFRDGLKPPYNLWEDYDFWEDDNYPRGPMPDLKLKSFFKLVECTKSSSSNTNLDITATDIDKRSIVHRSWDWGTSSNNCTLLEYLDSEFDLAHLVNMKDHRGNTPLHLLHTDAKALEILVRRSKDVCCRNIDQLSPLLCIINGLTGLERYLGSSSRNSNERHKIIQHLLYAGAWKDIGNPPPCVGGRTLFHSYYHYSNQVVLQLLVTKWPGYNHQQYFNVRDANGDTPLHLLLKKAVKQSYAYGNLHSPASILFDWVSALGLLIYGGADANIQDHAGNTPLMLLLTTLGTIFHPHLLGLYLDHVPTLFLFVKLTLKLATVLEHRSSTDTLSARNKAGRSAPELADRQWQIWKHSSIFLPHQCLQSEKFIWDEPPKPIRTNTLVVGTYTAMKKPWLQSDEPQGRRVKIVCTELEEGLKAVIDMFIGWKDHVDQMDAKLTANASAKDALA